MMSQGDLLEYIEAICKRPLMYTPNGSFYEVVCFTEGFATGANVGNSGHHFALTPFRQWTARKFSKDPAEFEWKMFRGLFTSEAEALEMFPKQYKEYLDDGGAV